MMSALVGSVAAYTVLLTLLGATAGHLWQPRSLPVALAAHRVVRRPRSVAAVVTVTEGLLGGAGIVAVTREEAGLLRFVLLAGSLLFSCYAGYTWHVWRTRRPGPCGCSGAEVPTTGWVVARAAGLAGLALVGLALAGAVVPVTRGGVAPGVVLLAAAAFTTLLWQLPAAMFDPATGHQAGGTA